MRVNIYILNTSPVRTWHLYVQSVTPANARNIVAALEAQGEHVATFKDAKVLGRLVYETPASI